MARSVRLKPDQEARLLRAARKRGVTISELVREAIAEKCERELEGESLYDRISDVIGAVACSVDGATRHSEHFLAILEEKERKGRL